MSVVSDGAGGCVVAVGRLISDLRDELKHRHDVDVYDDTTDSLLSRSIVALEHFAKSQGSVSDEDLASLSHADLIRRITGERHER